MSPETEPNPDSPFKKMQRLFSGKDELEDIPDLGFDMSEVARGAGLKKGDLAKIRAAVCDQDGKNVPPFEWMKKQVESAKQAATAKPKMQELEGSQPTQSRGTATSESVNAGRAGALTVMTLSAPPGSPSRGSSRPSSPSNSSDGSVSPAGSVSSESSSAAGSDTEGLSPR